MRTYIVRRGGWILKYFAGGLGNRRGMPDFLVAMPIPGARLAAFVAIEVKTGNAHLDKGQRDVKAELEAARVLYIVARCVDDVEEALLGAGLVESPALLIRRSRGS